MYTCINIWICIWHVQNGSVFVQGPKPRFVRERKIASRQTELCGRDKQLWYQTVWLEGAEGISSKTFHLFHGSFVNVHLHGYYDSGAGICWQTALKIMKWAGIGHQDPYHVVCGEIFQAIPEVHYFWNTPEDSKVSGGFEDFRGCKLNSGVLGKVSARYHDVDENGTDWYVWKMKLIQVGKRTRVMVDDDENGYDYDCDHHCRKGVTVMLTVVIHWLTHSPSFGLIRHIGR